MSDGNNLDNLYGYLLAHDLLPGSANERLLSAAAEAKVDLKTATPTQITELVLTAKILDEEAVTKARAAFFNVPYVDLRSQQIKPEVLELVPEDSRKFYQMVPFERAADVVSVALVDPANLQALEALEFLGQKQGLSVRLYAASTTSLAAQLTKQQNLSTVVDRALEDIAQTEQSENDAKPKLTTKMSRTPGTVLEDAPVIKIVDSILGNAIEAKASDIHIEPSENDVRVRYRIDGILHTSLRLPKNVLPAIVSRIKILCNLKIDEQRLPQDGRFHVELAGRSMDLRVSTLPLMYGEKIVMRLLDKTSAVPTLEQLGLRGKALAWAQENIKKTHGVFLITGPTGSGKSTTLYAILSLRNTTDVNIVTLEDPVEYFMEGVNQSQTNPEIGLTFASGLRSILRQDPNIIMVGEIRDEETAELAVHAALTGHLVFSTLHTNNAVGAIPRLTNMNIEPFLLTASVNLVMAQRLVRKLCSECKKQVPLTKIYQETVDQVLVGVPAEYLDGLDMKDLHVFEAVGCEKCGGTGYKGRFGIFEVLPVVPELQELIFGHQPAQKIYEAAAKLGVITMRQDGIIKALRGETTMDEIVRVTTE